MKTTSAIPEYIMIHHAHLQIARVRCSKATSAKLAARWQSEIEIHEEAIQQWKNQEEICQK